mmetsp:Transcript_12114/g.28738  ORF Transcript_12114/g.28738 Transcript_12114/m.28738 type:complete len:316 (+) Transcript_12114:758-1705(+)
MYSGLRSHSSVDCHCSHFVIKHSPDSRDSKHSSLSSLQARLSGLAVGDVVSFRSCMVGETDALGMEGLDVIFSEGTSDGEDVAVAATSESGSDELVVLNKELEDVPDSEATSVALSVGEKVSFCIVGRNVGALVLPIGASVGSTSCASVLSSYATMITSGSISCTPPSSIAFVMADEYAVFNCETYSWENILEEISMGMFVVTFTHKLDSGSPTGQSTSTTSTPIGFEITMLSLSDFCRVLRYLRVLVAMASLWRTSVKTCGKSISNVFDRSSSSAFAVTPLIFPFGTEAKNDVSTTTFFGGIGAGSGVSSIICV